MNQQEFKDRVANLLIDARVNAVLAEAEAKPQGGYGEAGPKPGFDINGRPRAPSVPPDRTPQLSPKERAKRLAAERIQAVTHGESTINQDFKDRLINIIMEKKVGELGQRNAAADTANRLRYGEGNAVAKNYVKAFKAKAKVEANSSKPMAEGNRSKALANATDPATINKLQATSDKARSIKALDNNKPGNVALNQMLGVGKDTKKS